MARGNTPRIPDHELDQLKKAADLVAMFEADTKVERDGSRFKACCPFHDERSPSCIVYPAAADGKGVPSYHCFGCGSHGDALTYLTDEGGPRRLKFLDAVRELAQSTGYWPEGLGGKDRRPAKPQQQPKPEAVKRESQKPAEDEKEKWLPILPIPVEALEHWQAGKVKHFRYGGHNSAWELRNVDDQVVGYVARYNRPPKEEGGPRRKEFCPWTWCKSTKSGKERWRARLPDPRPFYGEHKLAKNPHASVLVVEGEKAADAAQARLPGWVVVSPLNGHKSPHLHDWTIFAGRKLWFWPDLDLPAVKKKPGDFDYKGPAAWMKTARQAIECGAKAVAFVQPIAIARMILQGEEPRLVTLQNIANEAGKDAEWIAGIADPKEEHPFIAGCNGWDIADHHGSTDPIKDTLAAADRLSLPDASPPDGDGSDGPGGSNGQVPDFDDGDEPDEITRLCARQAHTDLGNAYRLYHRFGKRLRFSYAHSGWFNWTGTHWRRDRIGMTSRYAMKAVALIQSESGKQPPPLTSDDVTKHCNSSQSRKRREHMIADAADLPGMTVEDQEKWDADPYLLATPSGTIDLRTGELTASKREDYITRCTPVHYIKELPPDHPGMRALNKLLTDITRNDDEFKFFLQVAFGYSLLGVNPEERFFVVYGPGGSGKSTLMEAVKAALGPDLAVTAQFGSFIKSSMDRVRQDLARLAGPRFVSASESDEGQRLDAAIVKQLSGGDRFTSRFLYGQDFEFRPRFTLWLATNNRPNVRGDDDALFRRLCVVPFLHAIPKAERDPELKALLLSKVGQEAVLHWMVRGCLLYHHHGTLPIPRIVKTATSDYQHASDPIATWMEQAVQWDQRHTNTAAALYQHFEQWCDDEGYKPPSKKALGSRLRLLGADKVRKKVNGKATVCYVGVGLTDGGVQEGLPVTGVTDGSGNPLGQSAHATRATKLSFDHKEGGESVTSVTDNPPPIDPTDEDLLGY